MEWIELTKENLDREHICCAISSGKDGQAACKKAWLDRRLEEGLVFRKADARGKCFIEYLPGERAWVPVEAADLMWIDCLWVSGQLAGPCQGAAGHGGEGPERALALYGLQSLLQRAVRDPRDPFGEKMGQAPWGAGKGGPTWWNRDAGFCAASADTGRAWGARAACALKSPSGGRSAR